MRLRDGAAWVELRARNEAWLSPWEGSVEGQGRTTWAERHSPAVYGAMMRALRREARAGRSLPFAITHRGRLAGQLTVSCVVRGAFDSAYVGYWVDGALAGQGIAPTALALAVDHCFGPGGLHRVEANIRPENAASVRVVQKLGFRREGRHERYLYIDGGWRDHDCYAVTRGEAEDGILRRYRRSTG